MSDRIQYHHNCEEYMNWMGARVVAESGIVIDQHHIGKLILRSFRDAPEFVLQIDGGTGESQTFAEALQRSVRCATSLKNLGLMYQDTIYIVAKNHILASIPQYAALYQGFVVYLNDGTYYISDFANSLSLTNSKAIFCDSIFKKYVEEAVALAGISPLIIVFDEEGNDFNQFLIENGGDANVNYFRAANFDPADTIACIIPTSGSTGVPKLSKLTHTNFFYGLLSMGNIYNKFPTPFRLTFLVAPISWITTILKTIICPFWRITRLHTSKERTVEHGIDLIMNYRPTHTMLTPAYVVTMLRSVKPGQLDLSSLEWFIMTGTYVFPDLVSEIKSKYPLMKVISCLALTEVGGSVSWSLGIMPKDMSFTPTQYVELQLVDPTTLEVITKPYQNGELRVRGPSVFKGYLKNLDETTEALSVDGWFRTGDLVYKNENGGYHFVERLKMLMRYNGYQVMPMEIEVVIQKHPGVRDVAVTGIHDKEMSADLPVACVVIKDGWEVTAQDIKDLVKNSLPDQNQLRGGVLFLKNLPIRPNTKIDRKKLVELAKTSERE